MSTIKGSPLSANQYAVLMTDGSTGHVLTTDGRIFLNDKERVYTIFNDLTEARLFIKNKQDKNDVLEFTVYNSSYEYIEQWEAIK